MAGIQIGQLLVEQGVLSSAEVKHILSVQRHCRRPFGDLAERLFGVSPQAVEDAWVEQYVRIAGVVDLERIEVESECLRLLNRRQAWQFHSLPTSRADEVLNIATSAESLVRALNFSTKTMGEPVNFLIAEREQLREFLMKHYPVPGFLAHYAAEM
ncbi:MAG: hypothetical protein JO353_10875 [Phycisphaerae bacterium]|nr:hypothetical protein [Phycisphaerae bacterium]